MSTAKNFNKRRIFLKTYDCVNHIFTFDQHGDGTIYCASDQFKNAVWLTLELINGIPQEKFVENIGEGKLSLHGTGMVTVRSNGQPNNHQMIVKGNYLYDEGNQTSGVRHLFTVALKEPFFVTESSPLNNRESDYCLNADEKSKPLNLVFFAVPLKISKLQFDCNFHIEDLVNIPNDILGLHYFDLRYHKVCWFAYRTKHCEEWPKRAHFVYHDGCTFPIFIGTGEDNYRLEFRIPEYIVDNKTELTINCNLEYPNNYYNGEKLS